MMQTDGYLLLLTGCNLCNSPLCMDLKIESVRSTKNPRVGHVLYQGILEAVTRTEQREAEARGYCVRQSLNHEYHK